VRSYSEAKVFSVSARALLEIAVELVQKIPDPLPDEPEWRCHEVARAVGERLGLRVVDGRFGGIEHTWLVVPRGLLEDDRAPGEAILDVYAIGILPQVRLVDPWAPEGLLFVSFGRARKDIRTADVAALSMALEPEPIR
jgi:hypothetical protein